MSTKTQKIIYWLATVIFSAQILLSAGMYIFNHPFAAEAFVSFGYPTYIIYPLAVAKILGLLAIWTKKSQFLKEWAYAGFFFNLVLAAFAHTMIGDYAIYHAVVSMAALIVSYIYDKKLFGNMYKKELSSDF